jgi:hypothetical protein
VEDNLLRELVILTDETITRLLEEPKPAVQVAALVPPTRRSAATARTRCR